MVVDNINLENLNHIDYVINVKTPNTYLLKFSDTPIAVLYKNIHDELMRRLI